MKEAEIYYYVKDLEIPSSFFTFTDRMQSSPTT